jgi:diguanylate cyclase (GGDEF)-like protein/PAS domain S-box-containing protein
MTLRKQFLIMVVLLICALLGGIIFVSRGVLLNNFIILEEKQTTSDIETATKVIFNQIDQLNLHAKDWATWDDSYNFLLDGNQEYIDSNLTNEAFDSIQINFIIFASSDGTVVQAKGYDLEQQKDLVVPQSLIDQHLHAGQFLLKNNSLEETVTGLVLIPEGVLLVASRPILQNDGTGPSYGSLIIGRYLDTAEIQELSDLSNLHIQTVLFNDPTIPQDFNEAKEALNPGKNVFISTVDDQLINGYALLYDVYNNPVVIVKVDRSRDIYQKGVASFSIFTMIALVMGALFGLLFMHFLDTRVLKRMEFLSEEITQMGLNGDLSSRVSVRGADEISFLASEINKTFFALENSETALRQNEERLRLLVDGAEDTIFLQDLEGTYIYYNGPTQYRLSLQDVLGKKPCDLFDPQNAEGIMQSIHNVVESGVSISNELTSRHLGSDQWFSNLIYPVKNSAGEILAVGTISRNITAYKHMEERLRFAALHDPLTNLPNRAYFMEQLVRLTDVTKGNDQYSSALLTLDLDRFKDVNDTLGHPVGDLLLIEVGQQLRECLRPEDTIARLGGDEFGILLKKISGIQEVTMVADRIQQKFAKPIKLQGQALFITASIGIALLSSEHNNAEDLLRDADIAMYHAKRGGKNRYHLFDREIHKNGQSILKLESNLRQAIDHEEFLLYFQPVFSTKGKKISYLEALIRWNSPDLGIVSPADFIPIAEETGLIVPIGEWVLRKACAQLKIWRDEGYTDLQVAVNISARQLYDQNLVELVHSILQTTGLPGEALQLEITESVTMRDFEKTAGIFNDLSQMGVQISIDDFGTSYSSLNYLRRFAVKRLKIDRSFLRDISDDMEGAAIIVAIITIGHMLNMMIVAEGVETEKQLSFLVAQKCDEVQGFLFSQPLPIFEVKGALQKNDEPNSFLADLDLEP